MSPARRDRRRRDWPRGLYEPRPGYFIWRHPRTKQVFVLGRVPLAHAKNEALIANRHVAETSLPSLVAMLTGETHTIADLLAKMPEPAKPSSARQYRALDKRILAGLGTHQCGSLAVQHCAALIEDIVADGMNHLAHSLRSRLIAVCQRGVRMGWLKSNPAKETQAPKTTTARSRLSLEQFLLIRQNATEFLPRAMNLALVTGQDRSTVAAMMKSHIRDGRLICQRIKTNDKNPPVAIPLAIRLDAIGLSLDDLLRERQSILSRYLVHHVVNYPAVPAGSKVAPDRISAAFLEARRAAGIPDEFPDGKLAPTFHEIRSLAKRLYEKQGGVDTKQLLGHATEAMSKLYQDARDMAPIEVRIVNTK